MFGLNKKLVGQVRLFNHSREIAGLCYSSGFHNHQVRFIFLGNGVQDLQEIGFHTDAE